MSVQFAKIAFNINAVVEQTIMIIDPRYNAEAVVSGLDNGSLQTTISHQGLDTIGTTITETETGCIIARIKEQVVSGQHDIFDFNVSDPDYDNSDPDDESED